MRYTLNSWHVDFVSGAKLDLMTDAGFKLFAYHVVEWSWVEAGHCFAFTLDNGRQGYIWPHYDGLQEGRYF